MSNSTGNNENITYEELEKLDAIFIEIVPERKGLILKHCEYSVSSRRHGTTVPRRYNDFVSLHDVLLAKYPYRAVPRLPPKRVVVGGGSARFLQRRRAALHRWLSLVAAHPILAHDADTRSFLCEPRMKLVTPPHDEFTLATSSAFEQESPMEEMQATFITEQEQLRLVQLGLARLFQILERAEERCTAERLGLRELGAALAALAPADARHWREHQVSLRQAATLASNVDTTESTEGLGETAEGVRVRLALEAVCSYRELCARLSRGLHAERVAAAQAAPRDPAAHALLARQRYALKCALQESVVARAYAQAALRALPQLFRSHSSSLSHVAELWAALHAALAQDRTANNK